MSLFTAGLAVVKGSSCVYESLLQHPLAMSSSKDVAVIAIGKAAASMCRGAIQAIDPQIRRGLVITKIGYTEEFDPRFEVLGAGHPLPDQTSLAAGQRLLKFIAGLDANTYVLFLLSGGASALVEVLPDNASVEQLREVNAWLLSHALPIATMNAIRKRISCIKGGRLASLLTKHTVTCLAISDVQDNDATVIGSGLLVPDAALQQDYTLSIPVPLPDRIRTLLTSAPPAPAMNDPCFNNITLHVIANLEKAKQAVKIRAEQLGYAVKLVPEFISGNAVQQGKVLANALLRDAAGVTIWGGETSMSLPRHPGRGGRCQSLALSAAMVMQGHSHVMLLAAGTDGSDGPGTDAGAIVDGETLMRGQSVLNTPDRLNNNANDYLLRADAGSFLEASGDLIVTGPTGTNVMDLMIGIKHA